MATANTGTLAVTQSYTSDYPTNAWDTAVVFDATETNVYILSSPTGKIYRCAAAGGGVSEWLTGLTTNLWTAMCLSPDGTELWMFSNTSTWQRVKLSDASITAMGSFPAVSPTSARYHSALDRVLVMENSGRLAITWFNPNTFDTNDPPPRLDTSAPNYGLSTEYFVQRWWPMPDGTIITTNGACIFRVNFHTRMWKYIAGYPTSGGTTDGDGLTVARLSPSHIVVDSDQENIYTQQSGGVRRYNFGTRLVSTLGGSIGGGAATRILEIGPVSNRLYTFTNGTMRAYT